MVVWLVGNNLSLCHALASGGQFRFESAHCTTAAHLVPWHVRPFSQVFDAFTARIATLLGVDESKISELVLVRATYDCLGAEEAAMRKIGGKEVGAIPSAGTKGIRTDARMLTGGRSADVVSSSSTFRTKSHVNKPTRLKVHQRPSHLLTIEPKVPRWVRSNQPLW
jgi:hypothetical protein